MTCRATEPDNWRSAPLLGEDNDYVFNEFLGLERRRARGAAASGGDLMVAPTPTEVPAPTDAVRRVEGGRAGRRSRRRDVGKLLATLGADVVKVEPPDGAADAPSALGRRSSDRCRPEDRSLSFWSYNIGKRSVVMDYRTPEGRVALPTARGRRRRRYHHMAPGRVGGAGPRRRSRSGPVTTG